MEGEILQCKTITFGVYAYVSLARTSYRHCQVKSFPIEANHKAPGEVKREDDKGVEQEIS